MTQQEKATEEKSPNVSARMDRQRKGRMHSRRTSEDVVQPSAQKGGGGEGGRVVQGGLRAAGVKLNPRNSCA